MGYTTDFTGRFELSKPLTKEQAAYLNQFSETRRMKRNAAKTAERADPLREAVGLPVGKEGEFFVGPEGLAGQEESPDILDWNSPASTQPGLWCQWVPTQDGEGIEWNGAEKFYHYVEWLNYIVKNFLVPWGISISGEVAFQGEDSGDSGTISAPRPVFLAKKAKRISQS